MPKIKTFCFNALKIWSTNRTDTQTDATERITTPHSRVLKCRQIFDVCCLPRRCREFHGRSYHRALGARTPHQRRKLPKLEHVALNSASETGAKCTKLHRFASYISKIFWGLCYQTPYRGRATAPLPRPHFPQRSGASHLARLRLARGLRPLHRPPTRNPGSRTHPMKILATPISSIHQRCLWSTH